MQSHRALYESVHARGAAVSIALGERDDATYQHCSRVAGLAIELGQACALSPDDLRQLAIASGFHDVGKIGIPDAVLKKRSQLDENDWAIMKAHSAKGERIILAAGFEDGDVVAKAVRHHHERFDGGGYPDGLAGESIPFLARIIAVVDTYDAMTTSRIYGAIRTHAEVMTELLHHQGRQHDPHLVTAFARIIKHSRFLVA